VGLRWGLGSAIVKEKMKTSGMALMAGIAFSMSALAAYGAVTTEDFSRYQVILDRKIFGEPLTDGTTGPTNPPPTSFIRDIKLVAITENSNGELKVGFVDIKANSKSYYLPVGGSDDGIEVVDADYDSESALLKKGGDSQWINMNSDASGGSSQAAVAASPDGNPAGPRVPYPERMKRRRETIRTRIVEPPKLSGEALDKHLQEYNMELIRARGEKGPPLPIELTPEMDAQLVKEGVLPPLDQAQPDGGAQPAAPALEQPAE
jgi:hypothetical protein